MEKNDTNKVNPFTGKKHFNIINDDQFLDNSYVEYNKFINQSELLDETADGQLIFNVSSNLIDAVEKYLSEINRNDYTQDYYDWEFHLVSNNIMNAFCMPGGKIIIYSGILSITENEQALAFLLAHEMAHALLDHSRTQTSAYKAKNAANMVGRLGGIGLDLVGLSDAANVVKTTTDVADIGSEYLLLKPWGRDQEMEADELGMKIIHWAGYDINETPDFWQRMSENNSNNYDFFSTHPSDKKRIDAMNKLVLAISNNEKSYNAPVLSGNINKKNENNENILKQENKQKNENIYKPEGYVKMSIDSKRDIERLERKSKFILVLGIIIILVSLFIWITSGYLIGFFLISLILFIIGAICTIKGAYGLYVK